MTVLAKIIGVVEKFEGNGRKLGYPTANIMSDTDLSEGVYFGFANLGEYKKHPALIFIGTPTTVGSKIHRVEAHLISIPDKNYYDLELEVDIEHFHRPNIHFESINDLVSAMKSDEQDILSWIKSNNTEV